MSVLVFAGPSLRPEDKARWPEFQFWPPVARGDVLRALVEKPQTLVVIDGFFHARPAIPHKELLYALDAGVRVIGAASMGALRAAELAPLGMEGVGRIVDWFVQGRIEGDDEVAVLHEPREQGYRATTLALVEIRWILDELQRAGTITHAQAEAASAALGRLPFVDRRPDLVHGLLQQSLGEALATTVIERVQRSGLKRLDALRALRAAEEPTPDRGIADASRPERHTETRYLAYYREWSLGPTAPDTLIPSTKPADAPPVRFGEALRLFQLFHPQAAAWMSRLRRRFLLASATRRLLQTGSDSARVEALKAEKARRLANAAGAHQLPQSELQAEAELRVDARLAQEHFGGIPEALGALADVLGVPQEPSLEVQLDRQFDALPPWVAIRALVFSPSLEAALTLARKVARIDQAFRATAGQRRIPIPARLELAASLWSCAPEEVLTAGARRGLFPGDGYSPGLHDVLATVFPAERLGLAITDYEAAKQTLAAAPIDPESSAST